MAEERVDYGNDTEEQSHDAPSRKQVKGRGQASFEMEAGRASVFDRLQGSGGDSTQPQKSVEGWIIFITNVHEESTEEDLTDAFSEYGQVKNIHLNLDRRTGFVKGYCFIEYENQREAKAAIDAMDGATFKEKTIQVSWAFREGPVKARRGGRGGRRD
eukprot:TRINITY_DN6462_c0_g1_i3.p1 TRINITY_DN6462_c0_g1~~TRINITY_DN6462_c0_g1_i3.p1  ORF type:complete len:158 (+),score=38.48 TRINITY_DN6462_c0_g1_i3:71-544(+)